MGTTNLVPIPNPDDKRGVVRAIRKLASLRLNADSNPTFADLTILGSISSESMALENLTPNRIIFGTGSKVVDSVEDLTAWIAGTTDHITVTDDADGSVTLDLAANTQSLLDSFNGIFIETIDFLVTENAGTVTGSLNQSGGGDLTQRFSDGYATLDTTPALTVNLTAYVGTDAIPKVVYVYILQSDKGTIVASNTGWPATEHIKIADLILQSAVTTGVEGSLGNRNWNDHTKGTNNQGHITHIAERLRKEPCQWESGVAMSIKDAAGSELSTGSSSTAIELVTSEGIAYQLHNHTFLATDMYVNADDDAHVTNQPVADGGGFFATHDLVTDIVSIQDGTAIGVNKYFNLLVWGIQNKTGEASHIMVNLPSGQYTVEAQAITDANGSSIYDIPSAFKGIGFLIARLTFQLTAGSQWKYVALEDLRGQSSSITAGVSVSTTDHSLLTNLTADDHTQYLLIDGTRAMTGDLDMDANAVLKTGHVVPDEDNIYDLGELSIGGSVYDLELEQSVNNRTISITNVYRRGQTFIPTSDFELAKVRMNVKREQNGGDLICEIRNTVGGLPSGSSLGTATVVGDTITTDTGGEDVDFVFFPAVPLTNGILYAYTIHADTGSNVNFIIGRATPSQYANGSHVSSVNSGSSWITASLYDLYFLLYSDSGGVLTTTAYANLYLAGNLSDGTNELTVANAKTAYDHSLLTSGNPHSVTPAELSLVIGTNVQAFDAALTSISGLVYVSPSFIKLTADDTYAVRTIAQTANDLEATIVHDNLASVHQGVATGNSPTFANLSLGIGELTTGSINRASGVLTLKVGGVAKLSVGSASSTFVEKVTIGTVTPTTAGTILQVLGENAAVNSNGTVNISSNDSAAIDKGGSFHFGGVYTGTSLTQWAQISGRKENNTDGNYAGYLGFATRQFGQGTIEKMRLTSVGKLGVGTLSPKTRVTIEGALTLRERAAADGSTAAYGQLWVKNTTPTQLWFTSDTGVDTQIV